MDAVFVIALVLLIQFFVIGIASLKKQSRTLSKIVKYSVYPAILCLAAAIVIFIVGIRSSNTSLANIYIPIYLVFLAGASLAVSFLLLVLAKIIIITCKSIKQKNRNNQI